MLEERQGGVLELVEEIELLRRSPAGRPRRTWRGAVQQDLEVLDVEKGLPQTRQDGGGSLQV